MGHKLEIVCVCTDGNKITKVGVRNAGFGGDKYVLYTPEDVYNKMNGTGFVVTRGQQEVKVLAREDEETGEFEFLATYPDGTESNNLGELPSCDNCN